jgi:hypothetical protein
VFSGLGKAVETAVALKGNFERKKNATLHKVETFLSTVADNRGSTPGIRIWLKRHPNFKGSRIPRSFVAFVEKPLKFSPIYDETYRGLMASVNAG